MELSDLLLGSLAALNLSVPVQVQVHATYALYIQRVNGDVGGSPLLELSDFILGGFPAPFLPVHCHLLLAVLEQMVFVGYFLPHQKRKTTFESAPEKP